MIPYERCPICNKKMTFGDYNIHGDGKNITDLNVAWSCKHLPSDHNFHIYRTYKIKEGI